MRGSARALLAVCLCACSSRTELAAGGGAGPTGAAKNAALVPARTSDASTPRRHLLLVVELEPARHAARLLSARSVELPLPTRREARPGPWRVDVTSDTGARLFSAPLADASELRAEFPDQRTGELRGVRFEKPVAAVTLRLPWLKNAKLVRIVNAAGGEVELGRVDYPQVAP